jgi:hypothetical protein
MNSMRSAKSFSSPEAVRLVKTWLPAEVVRQMDEVILASGGAYNGRDDFIREAIADRIADERMRPAGGPAPVLLLRGGAKEAKEGAEVDEDAIEQPGHVWSPDLGPGQFSKHVPTLPAHPARGALYGLHNRDYPTLWATHSLLAMSDRHGGPLKWNDFLRSVVDAAWKVGAHLAKLDLERSVIAMKAAIGFPANREKRQSAEARFIAHMLGVAVRESRPTGPIFALQLAGTQLEDETLLVAPTKQAAVLWERLAANGLAAKRHPPHPDGAWRVFSEHIQDVLPEEYETWMAVLKAVAERPTRDELVKRFSDRWPGSVADTNVGGYVSRGREWGLIAPKLIEGRYAPTSRAERELAERR